MSQKYRHLIYLLKSNGWVQWQIALVLKGFALRLLCILSALRMCLNQINLWHLNLGLVLHYGRGTLQVLDFILFLSDSAAHYSSHSPATQWENFIYPQEETGQHSPLWSMQEAEFPGGDALPAKSTLLSLVRRLSSVSKCFGVLRNRDILTLDVIFQIWMLLADTM